jgi:high-affinity iron transporter
VAAAGTDSIAGVDTQLWQAISPADPGVDTPTVTLAQLAALTGGRVPVGLGNGRAPGPFAVTWNASTSYFVSTHGDSLVSARAEGNRIAVLRGGGLPAERTVSLGGLRSDWSTAPGEDAAVAATITRLAADHTERALWRFWLPILLTAAAVATAVLALRARGSSPTNEERQHPDDQRSRSQTIGVP